MPGVSNLSPTEVLPNGRISWLNVPDPLPTVDALLAAAALEHGMTLVMLVTLVTRNTRDVLRTGVALLNPFDFGG